MSPRLGDGDELRRHGGRVVESFGTLPRPSVGDRLALEVARREVDAQSDFGVETVGEARRDVARQSVDAHDQFAFVVHLLSEVGDVEGVVVAQQGRVGFQEEERAPRQRPAVEFGDVVAVVAADADDLHDFRFLHSSTAAVRPIAPMKRRSIPSTVIVCGSTPARSSSQLPPPITTASSSNPPAPDAAHGAPVDLRVLFGVAAERRDRLRPQPEDDGRIWPE